MDAVEFILVCGGGNEFSLDSCCSQVRWLLQKSIVSKEEEYVLISGL